MEETFVDLPKIRWMHWCEVEEKLAALKEIQNKTAISPIKSIFSH